MPKQSGLHAFRETGPIYVAIAAELRRALVGGEYRPGDRLPPLNAIAQRYSVAVVSVRSAVALLEGEGLLERKQGRGTYVRDDAICGKSLEFDTGFESLLNHLRGKSSITLLADEGSVMPMVGPEFGQITGPFKFMRRVHLSEGIPYALINIHIRNDIYLRQNAALDREMVIPIIANMPDVKGGRMQQRISFTTADSDTATHLDVPVNSAIGDLQRVITDAAGDIVYVGQTKYRGDFVNLKIDFDIPGEDRT